MSILVHIVKVKLAEGRKDNVVKSGVVDNNGFES